MRRPLAVRVLTLAAIALSTACAGDATTAPVNPAMEDASFARGGRTHARRASETEIELTETITIDPDRSRIYHVGQNWVYIPANAVCTLDTPYGPSEWDKPCDRATAPIEVTVTVGKDADGYPTASFSPDLRFAPAVSPRRWVILGLKMQGRLDLDGYGILYQPTGTDLLIDESSTDPTLRAWRARGNVVARRLKHFSGYNVSLGFTEQLAPLGTSMLGGW